MIESTLRYHVLKWRGRVYIQPCHRTKQIRINIKNVTVQKNRIHTTQNTQNTGTHVTKTQYKTHTYTHSHITKQYNHGTRYTKMK